MLDIGGGDHGNRKCFLTILAGVQAECGPLQHSDILANVPDVEIYKDWERGKSCHSQPRQHEDVCQHDELKKAEKVTITHLITGATALLFELMF